MPGAGAATAPQAGMATGVGGRAIDAALPVWRRGEAGDKGNGRLPQPPGDGIGRVGVGRLCPPRQQHGAVGARSAGLGQAGVHARPTRRMRD